jgi:hypothetical protein
VQPPTEPPPYNPENPHDWTVIPDTALLPPPPSIGYDASPTANATEEQGEHAYRWCQTHPLWQPRPLTEQQHLSVKAGAVVLLNPASYAGELLPQATPGRYVGHSPPKSPDCALLSTLPLYAALHDSPLLTEVPKTIYFEARVLGVRGLSRFARPTSFADADAGLAIGFVAPPYPTFRLPGWQRGSLGVHGDDGRRYVNDTFGGTDFTSEFRMGDTVGIGMTFRIPQNPPSYDPQERQSKLMDIEVFFTRNGRKEGSWDGNEELDQRSEGGTIGLGGNYDLFAAVGIFGAVDFEVLFRPQDWKYKLS